MTPIMATDTHRLDRAADAALDIGDRNNSMGLGITLAASDYAIPRARLARYLNERKKMYKKQREEREAEAADMWWNR